MLLNIYFYYTYFDKELCYFSYDPYSTFIYELIFINISMIANIKRHNFFMICSHMYSRINYFFDNFFVINLL